MKRKSYRIVDVKSIRLMEVKARLSTSKRAVFGIDVAKCEVVVSIGGDDGESVVVFKVKQPAELPQLFEVARELQESGYQVELAAESTGTYSDVLVYQARRRKLSVHQVSTKFVHDAKEIHDGVSSKHDAKDATLILWLHVQGKSRPWLEQDQAQRRAKAVVSRREIFVRAYVANAGRLEALLARHWPELLALATAIGLLLLKLLVELPSPRRIAANPEDAKQLLARHRSAEKMNAVLASAATSQGVMMIHEEEVEVSELAKQMVAQWREIESIDNELCELLRQDPVAARLAVLIGPTTAMALAADLGDLSTYASPKALEKACGLNLREHSSGKRKSGLHITKRGPPRARQYLYLAALRLLRVDPIVRAWYASRVTRGQAKMSAVVAVLRKLVRALVFVARGEDFQAAKLFDVRRLDVQQTSKVDVEATLAEALRLDDRNVSETTEAVPEPVPAAPEASQQASSLVPMIRRAGGKKECGPSRPKRAPSRDNTHPIERSKGRDVVMKAASTAPLEPDTGERNQTSHGTLTRPNRARGGRKCVADGTRRERPLAIGAHGEGSALP